MGAAQDAIGHVCMSDNQFRYHVIHDIRPVGISGLGIFDALAQLFSLRVIDKSGWIRSDPRLNNPIFGVGREFRLSKNFYGGHDLVKKE